MIEELENKYNEQKGVIEILPVNTKYNRKRKVDYIDDAIEQDKKNFEIVKKQIEDRLAGLNGLEVDVNIAKIEKELEKCNIQNEWNQYNTAYEKMHLDYYLYQLHRYYNEDLANLNECIKRIVESFKKVGIVLTSDDFDFNVNAKQYMKLIIDGASFDNLKLCFDEIYWKNSNIINILEINFKSIYLRYEKKITKYYIDRHNEFLKGHTDDEISSMQIKLNKKLDELRKTDPYLILEKFKNYEYLTKNFSDSEIEKKKEVYFSKDNYSLDTLFKVKYSLAEYNMLIKYNYLLVDMRDRLGKKDEFKNGLTNILKDISKDEAKLKKLVKRQSDKSILPFKKKIDDKWLFEYNETVSELTKKYDSMDDIRINELIFNKLTKDSSVYDVLKFIASNYLYFVARTKEFEDGSDINSINDKYEELRGEMYNHNNYMLINNLALLDERQVKQIIADKYNMDNIKLSEELLSTDNVERTIGDIELLIDYEYFILSGVNLEDIELYLEYDKILEKG